MLILAPLDIKGGVHCYFGLEATSPNFSSVFPRQPAVETEREASGGGEDTPALYGSLSPPPPPRSDHAPGALVAAAAATERPRTWKVGMYADILG